MDKQETGRRERNQLAMLRAVSRFERSGLTRSEFAKGMDITIWKLEYWRTRCRALTEDEAVGHEEPPREASPVATLLPLDRARRSRERDRTRPVRSRVDERAPTAGARRLRVGGPQTAAGGRGVLTLVSSSPNLSPCSSPIFPLHAISEEEKWKR